MLNPAPGSFSHWLMGLVTTMAIGLVIPPTGSSTAQAGSNAPAERGQSQERTQGGAFSVLLKDAVKHTDDDEQASSRSDAGKTSEPTPDVAVDDHAAGATLIGLAVVSASQAPEVASTVADKAEPVQSANANSDMKPTPTGPALQGIEPTPLLLQGLTVGALPDNGTPGHEPVAANPPQLKTTVSSSASLAQPALNPDGSSKVPATLVDSPATNKPAIRNGRGVPSQLVPVALELPLNASALSGTRPSSSLIPDQGSPPPMENQENLLPAAQGNGVVPSLARPSTDFRPSIMLQEQGDQETTLLNQSQSIRVIQDRGVGEQGSFGDLTQGEGEGNLFQFSSGGALEPVIRGNQSPVFIDQFMLAQQTQSLPQGTGSPVVMSTTDHLKLAQSLLGLDHSATMTTTSGMPQTIHLELPSHDSGPLNVRISMIDQTVYTQFTTDRSDLGALLFMRQDQLQQTLTKSGLELGQFQVHVNQEGRQDASPDRQSRRNDGTSEQQQPASQDHHPQAQDRERPNHRPLRALSLFA